MGLFNKVQDLRKQAGMANDNIVSGDTSMDWKRQKDEAAKPKISFGKRFTNFFKETYAELKKVTWPTRQEVIRGTLLVIGVSLAFSLYLGGLDYLFTKLLDFILKVTGF